MTHLRPEFDLTQPATDPALWMLNPRLAFLNHGSFGSCPQPVFEFQQTLRRHLEWQPVQFFVRELEALWDKARRDLAAFLQAEPENLVFVPNASAGVNTVLRSLSFSAGDELLVTNQEYNACRNALDFAAERSGARVIVADVPFPLARVEEVISPVLEKVTDRTRLVLLDHVTSQTGLVLPVESIIRALRERGVAVLIDGAHAPGMLPLHLRDLGATYYTGNCHKWICAPKGAAFLYVSAEERERIRPLTISHGANSPRTDRSRYLIEFGWTGTSDPTAWLAVPAALRCLESAFPGGWPELMRRNRALALAARKLLCDTLQIEPPAPDEMIRALAAVPLPDSTDSAQPVSPLYADPLQDRLREEFSIEVPIVPWPGPPKRVLRISAQLYNSLPHYERLGAALKQLL